MAEIPGGHRVTIQDVLGVKTFDVLDGTGGGSGGGGGSSITVDSALSDSSTNPVQNKVIKSALDAKGTYSKPTGGIPKTDLASAVQTSLGKADAAIAAPTSPTNGAFLVWNGSAWVAQTLEVWEGGSY